MHDFELFYMKPSETIRYMYTCFMDVINSLKALDKIFSNLELINKILRFLTKSWDPKVMTVQKAKDLNYFFIEELIGSLMTYEMTYVAYNKLENNLPKNRKDFTLKTKEDHSSESSSDDELEFLIIKLKKFLKQESKNKNKF